MWKMLTRKFLQWPLHLLQWIHCNRVSLLIGPFQQLQYSDAIHAFGSWRNYAQSLAWEFVVINYLRQTQRIKCYKTDTHLAYHLLYSCSRRNATALRNVRLTISTDCCAFLEQKHDRGFLCLCILLGTRHPDWLTDCWLPPLRDDWW